MTTISKAAMLADNFSLTHSRRKTHHCAGSQEVVKSQVVRVLGLVKLKSAQGKNRFLDKIESSISFLLQTTWSCNRCVP